MDGLAVTGESQQDYLPPAMRAAMVNLRAEARALGIVTEIPDYGGARTKAITDQLIVWRDEAVKNGEPYYRVSPFETGKHGVGGAEDLRVTKRPAGMSLDQAYATLGRLAPKHGLIWGGTFSAPADPFHFESQKARAELSARWDAWRVSPEFPKPGIVASLNAALSGSVALSAAEHSSTLFILLGVATVAALVIFSRRAN